MRGFRGTRNQGRSEVDPNSSRQVFQLRKTGQLKAAYELGLKLYNEQPEDEWIQRAYAWVLTDIIKKLKESKLIVVEGTLYPLLSRLKNSELLAYSWKESKSGPPRKYYTLTKQGEEFLGALMDTWQELSSAVNQSTKSVVINET